MRSRLLLRALSIVALGMLAAQLAGAAEHRVPQFMTGREPVAADAPIPPDRWSTTENVRWKMDLPGIGWSSPIVWGNRIYLTTCVNSGETADPRKGLYLEDLDANKYPKQSDPHQWKVYCLDLETGDIVWEQVAHEGVPAKPHHIKNSLASETPATDGERIYAHFGNLGLFCYDMDGKLLWKHEVTPHETRYGWGTSSSPIVYKDRVYLLNDNEEESYMVALDKRTGETVWRIEREEDTNYSTPFIWENDLRTELVVSGIGYARSYDLEGRELWRIKGLSILAIPVPQARFGMLFLTSGHVAWGENPFYAIKPGASGDISPVDKKVTSEFMAWYQPAGGPYHPTPIIVDETIYVLLDRGFMMAFDAKTGAEVYGRARIPNGRAFTSSPWTYGGKIFCINEYGQTFVVEPGNEFKLLWTNDLAEDDMGMSTPVIVGDKLLIRTGARLYCIAEGGASTAAAGGN